VIAGTFMAYSQAGLVHVTRNYLHDNAMDSKGYGVVVSRGAYAVIDGNVFDYNRHAVASGGEPHTGYIVRHNYVQQGGFSEGGDPGYWNQHFDVHGVGTGGYGGLGGERYDIVSNTIRGEQEYGLGFRTRPAFMLRGIPDVGAFFHHNVVVHEHDEAARIKDVPECWVEVAPGVGYYDFQECNLTADPNTYNTDTTGDLGVGDFDADGIDDVFLANGTAWWYSSAGRTEWRFLRPSPLRMAALRLGQFDDDRRTDVLQSDETGWRFWSGGTGASVLLRSSGTALGECVFGDFDGNGLTDALRTTGSMWFWIRDSRWTPQTVRSATATAANLRVGDFDGDGADEVFLVENGRWSLWQLGSSQVSRLPVSLTSSVSGLVVGDFDGDHADDIAQTNGGGWRFSRRAREGWDSLREAAEPYPYNYLYRNMRDVLIGQFNPDTENDDALRYDLEWTGVMFETGTHFIGWDHSQDAFVRWSETPVR
jgi:hypothetical protein